MQGEAEEVGEEGQGVVQLHLLVVEGEHEEEGGEAVPAPQDGCHRQ